MDFFNSLSDSGIFFFCVVVFLVVFLLFLSIFLINKNKKLKKMIEDNVINDEKDDSVINEEIKENLTNNISAIEDDIVSISLEKNDDDNVEENVNIEVKDDIKEETKEEINTGGAYQKNVLREMSKKMTISPIDIKRSSIDDDTYIYTISNDEEDYGINEIYLREDSTSPLEQMEDSYEINDNMKFASEIISRMEEEVIPSNIELTDYERKQEEEAIISYGELEKVKDRIYNLTLEEEDSNFIDELKNFRSDL